MKNLKLMVALLLTMTSMARAESFQAKPNACSISVHVDRNTLSHFANYAEKFFISRGNESIENEVIPSLYTIGVNVSPISKGTDAFIVAMQIRENATGKIVFSKEKWDTRKFTDRRGNSVAKKMFRKIDFSEICPEL